MVSSFRIGFVSVEKTILIGSYSLAEQWNRSGLLCLKVTLKELQKGKNTYDELHRPLQYPISINCRCLECELPSTLVMCTLKLTL